MTERIRNQKQAGFEAKVFPVPFALAEIKNNITVTTNSYNKLSKEEIINQAYKFHSKGNIKEAAKYYEYFYAQGFKDPNVFNNYGCLLADLKDLKKAELFTRKAIELKPDFADANFNLGTTLIAIGKSKEAELFARKAIDIKPDCDKAHNNLGIILKDLDKPQEAEISFSKAIDINPSNANALINRWQLFFSQRKFDLALRDSDSCDTELSRSCSLETLYALGRIEEIYQRIEKNSKLDERNIRIAAFSSFIAEQEDKDTANNFCRNPLSFFYTSNVKNHIKDCNTFIKGIISELSEVETEWEPRQKTTINGFQTPMHINLFSNSSKNISQLKSIILNELHSYYLKYEKESCLYIQKWPSNKKLHAWYVILKKQGYQDAHIHPSGWLSGVIYLKVVPPLNKNEGAIELSLNGPNYSNPNSPTLIHQPEVGDIIFFPSSLYHRTIPFSTDTERIVMAFDLFPN